jgi:hypothetical protein
MSLNRRRIGRRAFFLVPIFLVPITMSATGSGYLLSRSNCLPDAPLAISRNFIDLVRAGEFDRAYQLTDRRISVGSTLAAFEAKIRDQLPIDTFPTSPVAELIGSRSGFQSCGNRLRRWVSGRKIDPDIMSVDYLLGAPFEVRLTSDNQGQWRISYFQSHAM